MGEDLAEEIQGLRLEQAASGVRREAVARRLRDAETRRRELERKVRGVRRAEEEWARSLGSSVRQFHAARLLSSPYYGSDDLYAEAWIERSVAQDAVFLERMRGFESAAEKQARDILRQRETLRRQSTRTSREHGDRTEEIEEKARALKDARMRGDRAMARVQELEESARAMTKLIESLGRKPAPAPRPREGRPSSSLARHSLPWPVDGKVVSRFGRREVPDLRTWTVQHGIELAARSGADVRSVGPGQVIFAGPFRSYGQVVIVDHGSEFLSLYGRLGGIAKSKGDAVASGEVVGTTGEAETGGISRAPKGQGAVYFEIRRKGDPLDPLAWLQRKR